MNTGIELHVDESNINLKVAVDLFAEHQRLQALHLAHKSEGDEEKAEMFLKQSGCIYNALCVLAKHYGFDLQDVITEYERQAWMYELRSREHLYPAADKL